MRKLFEKKILSLAEPKSFRMQCAERRKLVDKNAQTENSNQTN